MQRRHIPEALRAIPPLSPLSPLLPRYARRAGERGLHSGAALARLPWPAQRRFQALRLGFGSTEN